jgi:hypothetical protein
MPPVAQLDEYSAASFSVGGCVKSSKDLVRPSVEFNDAAFVVHEFEKISRELQNEIWYNRDEYQIIKARNSLIVKMAKAQQFEESSDHTFRGLEHKLKTCFKERRANKFNALNAVLDAQEQLRSGVSGPESIALAYSLVARHAKEVALDVGMRDSVAARESRKVTDISRIVEAVEETERGDDDSTVVSDTSYRSKTSNRIRRMFRGNRRRSL